MKDPYAPVPAGTRGTVKFVDDMGTIFPEWDNGRSLGVVPGEDSFRKLTQEEIEAETNRAQEVEQQIWDSIGLTDSKIDEEINRAKAEEKRIEGEIPDGSSEVIARLNGGVIIPSKEPGANDITINIDADFGTF